jgi:hypothetical protein
MMDTKLIDSCPEDAARTLAAFAAAEEGIDTYLLIDTALAPTACARVLRRRPALASTLVFEGRYAVEALVDLSPRLLALPENADEHEAFFDDWLQRTRGLPMLSVIQSVLTLPALNAHLQAQLEAVDSHDRAYVLRWADTRSLSLLRDIFTPAQQARWMADITAWAWFDRAGAWTVMDGIPVVVDAVSTRPYRLDERQMEVIQASAMADTLLAYLHDNRQGLQIRGSLSSIHARILAQVERLRAQGDTLPTPAEATRHAVRDLLAAELIERGEIA